MAMSVSRNPTARGPGMGPTIREYVTKGDELTEKLRLSVDTQPESAHSQLMETGRRPQMEIDR